MIAPANPLSGWRDVPPNAAPYLYPGDRPVFQSGRFRKCGAVITSYADYIASPGFSKRGDPTLQFGLLPQPYVGDVERARVVILMLNPGLTAADFYAEERDTEFRTALVRNLRQEVRGAEFPFLFLDPRFAWHPGYTWWAGKLASVVELLAAQRSVSNMEAQRTLAQGIASIELVPYHSIRYGLSRSLLHKMPSVAAARSYVKELLLPRSNAGDVTIIVARAGETWGLSSQPNVIIYDRFEARGAHLTPDSSGGRAIVSAFQHQS